MTTAAFQTFSTMMDELPAEAQETLIEKIRPIVADMVDEYRWNRSYQSSSAKLEAFAANVRQNTAKAFEPERL
ncbi:MAG: hypothetical protein M0P91_10455 [Sulfuricurvum sp.]|jgi:hypothetical protein|uniref:hypothetical protein n=1 Tax=Sulfuricurvum sp. TaxID=2025608 RepID=UPI0025DF7BF3|nr:hypothetical protein [Sulfuricurvum sp.]MCK9373610.1 hypothetical protein [Sulfuricurvum sp.]